MNIRTKYLSPSETLDLIKSKAWAKPNDVYLLSGKGKNATGADIKAIRESLEKEGYKLPKGVIPMDEVIKYYKINISYLKKISNLS